MFNFKKYEVIGNQINFYSQKEILKFLFCQKPLNKDGILDTSVRRSIARAASFHYQKTHPDKKRKDGTPYSNVYFDSDNHDLQIINDDDFVNMLLYCCDEKIDYQTYIYRALFSAYHHKNTINNARYLLNFVVDIDYHDKDNRTSKKEMKQAIDAIYSFLNQLIYDFKIPEPTMISSSGRGLHIFYTLVPYKINTKEYLGKEKLIYKILADKIEEYLLNNENIKKYFTEGFSVDKKAGMSLTGRIRCPFSYNQKSETYDTPLYFCKKLYNLNDFLDFFDVEENSLEFEAFHDSKKVSKSTRKKLVKIKNDLSQDEFIESIQKDKIIKEIANVKGNLPKLMMTRFNAFKEIIITNRGNVESRHVVLYKVASFALVFFRETDTSEISNYRKYLAQVKKTICEFNQYFNTPVKNIDIEKIIHTLENRLLLDEPAYCFTDKNLFDKVGKDSSMEEMEKMQNIYNKWKFIIYSKSKKSSSNKNHARMEQNRKKKEEKLIILYELLKKYSKKVNLNTCDAKMFKRNINKIINAIISDEMCPFCAKTVKIKLAEWVKRQWICANWKNIKKILFLLKKDRKNDQKRLYHETMDIEDNLISLMGKDKMSWYSKISWNKKYDYKYKNFHPCKDVSLLEKWDAHICGMSFNKKIKTAIDDCLYKGCVSGIKSYFSDILNIISCIINDIAADYVRNFFNIVFAINSDEGNTLFV